MKIHQNFYGCARYYRVKAKVLLNLAFVRYTSGFRDVTFK